ncbi:MAG: phosphoglycerate mutase family protein [Acidimicrobiales bacterium]|nr:histidine phosphatase family protein [Actinomycetota bacterium]
MEIHLVRHAHAGSRKAWDDDDRERPLSERGQAQARGVLDDLADVGVDRLWSSSYVRCVQTLDPLADRLGLEVEVVDPLTEGGSGAEALDLLLYAARSGLTVAACSHGDVIPAVVATALGRGARLDGPASAAKGGRYVLSVADGAVTALRYVPPSDRR